MFSRRKKLILIHIFWSCFAVARASAFAPGRSLILHRNANKKTMSLRKNRPNPASQHEKQPLVAETRGGATKLAATTFENAPFFRSTLTFAALNALGFIISLFTGSHLHLDLLGTGAFAVAALQALVREDAKWNSRTMLSSIGVTAWGTKLAGFLFYRALIVHTDARLEDTLSTLFGTFGFWTISLLWGVICSLPWSLGLTSSAKGNTAFTYGGFALHVFGLAIETLSDIQKWQFKQTHPGQFCNVGLWAISQHPNFFGNLCLWIGIFLMNAPSLIEVGPKGASLWTRIWGARRLFLALLSPLFMWTLFSGQANGTIGNAVEMSNAKYGSDPAYRTYVETVPTIIPNPMLWFSNK